ncbi:putative chitine binding protein [Triangularia verruculosa]|uniref:Chitine binding protein n=1 Tax=Triangularia verruculosa TaxID=2587418 RepID=A0AAN7AT26_9PEZI|nr:putative chitine binding protein [Triangularia verruculosa]
MRSAYFGLAAAALSWTSVLASESNAIPNAEALIARRPRALQNRHRNGTADYAQLGLRQEGGRCGAGVGRCPDGQCCSDYGFCGLTVDHCHPLFDCQTQYGVCGWPPPVPPATTSTPPPPPTTTSRTSTTTPPPPPTTTSTTAPPPPPTTTSTSAVVIPPSSTSSRPSIPEPTGPLVVTTNGQCGNGTMCIGNPNYGPCCSQYFWCGSSIEFCGAGCQSNFGACLGIPGLPGSPINGTTTTSPVVPPTTTSSPVVVPPTTTSTTSTTTTSTTSTTIRSTTSTTSTTSVAPTPTLVLPPGQRSSTDGRCGNGQNCLGSNFGRCCSQFGWCGDGDQFCPYIVGCQSEFGYCDPN